MIEAVLRCAFLLALGAPVAPGAARAQGVVDSVAPLPVRWDDLPALPEPGLGGPFVGVATGVAPLGSEGRDVLLVAGGANFPDAPPWEGGVKVWHDEVLALHPGADAWVELGRLDRPLAYGATVALDGGLLLIGGSDTGEVTAEVRVLRPRADGAGLDLERWPDLPEPSAFCSAVRIGTRVYVAAGKRAKDDTELVRAFWCADTSDPDGGWESLPTWSGAARQKTVLVAQIDGYGVEHAYLFGGEVAIVDAGIGADDGLRIDVLRESWRFDPGVKGSAPVWTRLADLPRPLAAGSGVRFGQSHVLLLSGVSSAHLDLPVAERPGFAPDVLAYHTITDTWVRAGEMPRGVVTTSAVEWNDAIVVPTGELRPGVRTSRVQRAEKVPRESTLGAFDLGVLVVYLAVIVAVGVFFARRERTTRDFFVAGKRIPWWAAGVSIFATQLSAITFVGAPAVGYATSWRLAPGWTAILLVAPLVVVFYLPFFRRLDVTTAYEYLERRFSFAVRLYGSLTFTLFQIGRMAIVVYLPALALAAFTGIDVVVCIVLIGGLATLYTALGGMEAVIWTDVVQAVVLLGGMLVALALVLVDLGGVGPVVETARAAGKLDLFVGGWSWTEYTTATVVIGSCFMSFSTYTTDQATIQRYLTTTDERSAGRAIWLNGLASVPVGLIFFALGTALFAWFRAHPGELAVGMANDEVFPLFVTARLPAGLSGLVIAGVFAASMSSLDSSMHGIATTLTTDVWRRLRPEVDDTTALRGARGITVAMGALGTGVALWLAGSDVPSLMFLFQKLIGLFASGLAGVFVLGLFTRRANATGALAGALVSFGVLCWLVFATDVNFYHYATVGTLTAVAVGYVASRLTAAPLPERVTGLTWPTRPAG